MSQRAGSRGSLVPGRPVAVLLCRYRGLDPARLDYHFEVRRLLGDGATVARIAGELDALGKGPKVPIDCPAESGLAIVAWFRYASGPPDPVRVGLDGCMSVSNGHVFRIAGVQARGRALLATMKRLVPVPRATG